MTHADLRTRIAELPALLVYYSTPSCGVCTVLRPKVEQLLSDRYPKISFLYVDTEESPEAAAQESIFAVPTIVVYFNGREQIRLSRHFGVGELEREISRPYNLLFG